MLPVEHISVDDTLFRVSPKHTRSCEILLCPTFTHPVLFYATGVFSTFRPLLTFYVVMWDMLSLFPIHG